MDKASGAHLIKVVPSVLIEAILSHFSKHTLYDKIRIDLNLYRCGMLRLVTSDLSEANLDAFESYEATVLSLLSKYGAKLEKRLRATNNSMEMHLLAFPDAKSYEAYLADDDRLNARSIWDECGAKASSIEVTALGRF